MQKVVTATQKVVLPRIVRQALSFVSPVTKRLYVSVCKHSEIEELPANEEGWIAGRLRETKISMYRTAGVSNTSFYKTCWPELRNAKLMIQDENDKGVFLLPLFRKKPKDSYTVMISKELEKRMQSMERHTENLEKVTSNLIAGLERNTKGLQRQIHTLGIHIDELEAKPPARLWRRWRRTVKSDGR